MRNKTIINNMTEGNITKQLVVFAFPFMLASFLQMLYAMVDMLVVGQFNGQIEMASISVGSQLSTFFTHLGIGFSGAAQIMIAQYVGAKDTKSIERTIGTAFTSMGVMAIVLGGICVLFCRPLLRAMNTPTESFVAAVSYMCICGFGMIFIYGYNVVSAILRGMGDSRRPLYFIAVAAVVNIVLDVVLVGAFHMGAAGAAVATVAGQGVAFLWSLVYLYRRRDRLGFVFHPSDLIPERKMLLSLARMGFPMALQSAAISISILYINSWINGFGVTAAAITGVGQKLIGIVTVVSSAISTAMSTLVGQNMAAGKPERVQKLVRSALLISVSVTGVAALFCAIFPEAVVSIFNSEPELLAMAPQYMHILVVGIMACSMMGTYYGVINGIGYASLSLVIGLLDGVVARIGLALLLGNVLGMGIRGFWLGDALAGYVTGILSALYYYSGKWKTYKLLINR